MEIGAQNFLKGGSTFMAAIIACHPSWGGRNDGKEDKYALDNFT